MDSKRITELAEQAELHCEMSVWMSRGLERFAALIEREVRGDAVSGDIHSCSYFCHRPECIRAQRDELRDRMESASAVDAEPVYPNAFLSDVMTAAGLVANGKQSKALSERLLKDVIRLRTHPTPAVVRQPIGEERLLDLAEKFDLNRCEEIIRFVRRIERRLGVVEDNKKHEPVNACPACGSEEVRQVYEYCDGEKVASADECNACGHQWNVG